MSSTTTSPSIILHPSADILLTTHNPHLQLKCVRTLLRLSSPIFSALLDPFGSWEEAKSGVLSLPHDSDFAVRFIAYGLHHRLHELSPTLEPGEVWGLALFGEKNDCLALVRGWMGLGCWSVRTSQLTSEADLVRWICTCHVLGWKPTFLSYAELWLKKSDSGIEVLGGELVPQCMLAVLEKLIEIRERTIEELWNAVDGVETGCRDNMAVGEERDLCNALGVSSHFYLQESRAGRSIGTLEPSSAAHYTFERPPHHNPAASTHKSLDVVYRSLRAAQCSTLAASLPGHDSAQRGNQHSQCGWKAQLDARVDKVMGGLLGMVRREFEGMEMFAEPRMEGFVEEVGERLFGGRGSGDACVGELFVWKSREDALYRSV